MSSEHTNNSSTTLHDELAQQLGKLDAAAPVDSWRVERVLKQSPSEVTQVVYLRLAGGGELGPYVRKLVSSDAAAAGLGGGWAELLHAQQAGVRFSHLPRVISCERGGSGEFSVVMEYVRGITLRELVLVTPANGREELAARLMPGLCDAAAELHEKLHVPIIHRDITPSNVICCGPRCDEVVLVDLGIARTWKPGADSDTTHFGTRAYAAPEQFGFGQTDARTDVYALGLVAFFCLAGRDPVAADREQGFEVEGVPEAWQAVIARATAFDPAQRYATARELRNALPTRELGAELGATPLNSTRELGATPLNSGATSKIKTASQRANRNIVEKNEPLGGRGVPATTTTPRRRQGMTAPAVLLKKLWRQRNFVVVPVALLLVAASVSAFVNPVHASQNPLWYDAFGYLVYMNYIVVAIGFLAMDKHWLREHVRFVGERTTGQLVRAVALVLGLLTVILIVLSMFADA